MIAFIVNRQPFEKKYIVFLLVNSYKQEVSIRYKIINQRNVSPHKLLCVLTTSLVSLQYEFCVVGSLAEVASYEERQS